MKKFISLAGFNKQDINTYILLLSAPLLLALYRYHGYAHYFGDYFPSMRSSANFDFYSHIWQFGVFFVLTLIVPVIIIRYQFKQPLKEFGLRLGDMRFGLLFVLFAIPLLVVPFIYLASTMPDVRAEYPLAKILLRRHDLIFWYELAYLIFYYIAWEFFFRGFLLFGLKDRLGSFNAILIQTISSCLVHIGKPEAEILGSIVLGIIFGMLALRTKSIWYVFILHAFIGTLTDLFIIFL